MHVVRCRQGHQTKIPCKEKSDTIVTGTVIKTGKGKRPKGSKPAHGSTKSRYIARSRSVEQNLKVTGDRHTEASAVSKRKGTIPQSISASQLQYNHGNNATKEAVAATIPKHISSPSWNSTAWYIRSTSKYIISMLVCSGWKNSNGNMISSAT